MSSGLKLTGLAIAGILCLPVVGRADTQTTHRVHSKKKAPPPPPPLPSGTQGPVPQIPLDSIPAIAPTVSYEGGLLTIVAPNSTLGDILRGVRKHTSADIEVPPSASERVATRLGPAPPREVMAELLNGSHFNYILLGSSEDANALVRVVLVAKTGPDTPGTPAQAENTPAPVPAPNAEAPEAEAAEENTDDSADQSAAEAEQPPQPEQPGVKTPQQMLQEMQQRQLMMQQQQANQPGVPLPPAMPAPHQPQPQPQEQQ